MATPAQSLNENDVDISIRGEVAEIRTTLATGVTDRKTIPIDDLFGSFYSAFKPFKSESSPFMSLEGTNYTGIRLWKESANGNCIVVTESTPRIITISADVGRFQSGDCPAYQRNILAVFNPEKMHTFVLTDEKAIADFGPLANFKMSPDAGSHNGVLHASVYMPYTIMFHQLVPNPSTPTGKSLTNSWVAWSDKPINSMASNIFGISFPNTYCAPWRNIATEAAAKVCWGQVLKGSHYDVGSTPSLTRLFYDSKSNTDLTNHAWWTRMLPIMTMGPSWKPGSGPTKITGKFIEALASGVGPEALPACNQSWLAENMGYPRGTVGRVLEQILSGDAAR